MDKMKKIQLTPTINIPEPLMNHFQQPNEVEYCQPNLVHPNLMVESGSELVLTIIVNQLIHSLPCCSLTNCRMLTRLRAAA